MLPRKPIPEHHIFPDNWDTEIVPRIMKRANDCCEVCGIKHWTRVYCFKLLIRDRYKELHDYYVSFLNIKEAIRECPPNQEVQISNAILRVGLRDGGVLPDEFTDDMIHAVCQTCEYKIKNKSRFNGYRKNTLCSDMV